MSKGLTEESYALLTNPSIDDKVLEALYKKADCFAQVEEGDWMQYDYGKRRIMSDLTKMKATTVTLIWAL